MPEVAEVAHVVALLRRNILGSKIASINIHNDPLLFPVLKGAANPEKEIKQLHTQLLNSVIHSVGRHGKYFWIRVQPAKSTKTGVLLMHLGMTGMIKLRDVDSHLILMENGGDKKVLEQLNALKKETDLESSATKSKYFKKEVKVEVKEEENTIEYEVKEEESIEEETKPKQEWPPRFSKLEIVLEKTGGNIELAFDDARRLGRVRYLTGDRIQTDSDLLGEEPLGVLGPDYSKSHIAPEEDTKFVFGDPDPHHHGRPRLTLEQFNKVVLSKKKPIKSFLLDQTFFAGVGNWVADEILYQSRIHPEEVISQKITFDESEVDPRIQKLYESLIYVCEESVKVEGDSKQFPPHWLMLYRWGKARSKSKPVAKTGEGYKVDYVTVGGRTSCFVPELQKGLKKAIETREVTEKKKAIEKDGAAPKRKKRKVAD